MNRGLTLMEMLMVVVLLAITVAMVGAGFSSMAGDARLRQAAAVVRDLDSRARLLAQSEGPLRLDAPIMHVVRDRDGTILLSHKIPGPIRVDLCDDNRQRLEFIWYDSRGRSADYRVVVSHGTEVLAWDVAGLTGWFVEAR